MTDYPAMGNAEASVPETIIARTERKRTNDCLPMAAVQRAPGPYFAPARSFSASALVQSRSPTNRQTSRPSLS
jgi:hypothetical protein